ncbi:MAG: hypothetical protein DWQ31_17195 [Planctomycetota bacterium]|nr:MAG: hypothetical protein DWQ31_17195 [Planctomycetota bacterium]REJ92089.1 MAG: hypothetical protein DWQ35_13145 [Planctomycetota bacterium]REK28625.1 MAG: hypothetical protein DWQ42_04735 [Planctomycetota bacterium]REK39239.1 MAG: hypothetical protein DWQ46_18315 [Planctomycetota bacterium]
MSKIEINYDDVQGVDEVYVENLKQHEDAIRNAIAKIGRSTWVRWTCEEVGNGNLFFRLVSYSDRSDCIARISPLDLTLESDEFEKLITEGKRTCPQDA